LQTLFVLSLLKVNNEHEYINVFLIELNKN